MTTIFTDGKYLIADQRTRGNYRVRDNSYKVKTDDSDKITLTPKHVFVNGLQVKAIAQCGSLGASTAFIELLKSHVKDEHDVHIETLSKGLKYTNVCSGGSCTLVMLTSEGVVVTLSLEANHSSPTIYTSVTLKKQKKDEILGWGSGSTMWDRLHKFAMRKIELIDAFSFCAHNDEWSSDRYVVYSLEQDKTYSVSPKPEEIEMRVRNFWSSIDPHRPSVKPVALNTPPPQDD